MSLPHTRSDVQSCQSHQEAEYEPVATIANEYRQTGGPKQKRSKSETWRHVKTTIAQGAHDDPRADRRKRHDKDDVRAHAPDAVHQVRPAGKVVGRAIYRQPLKKPSEHPDDGEEENHSAEHQLCNEEPAGKR